TSGRGTRNGVAPYSPAALPPGCEKRRKRRARGGVTGTVAASLPLTLRQWDGNPLPRRGRAETAQLARCAA
ncbi:hypothetical protein CI419_004706, partial [Salmonella enterica subsp. enterica serovar 4,[5],12:i:-]|nr:hypothetical protein [Salmonella enterica]EDV8500547.1 hypothetical protein [Salmonella enterica subsp. enterica serovar 4,[5],12:i:-]EEJ4794274.1 hypothetical protein [Salmonella enterica subsp. enterica serovar 4,[5],12:i:-]